MTSLIDNANDTWLPLTVISMPRRFRSAVVFAPQEVGGGWLPEGEPGQGDTLLLQQNRDGWRNNVLAWCLGSPTGTWLVHDDWIPSSAPWTVPARAVLKAHGGSDNVNVRLGQLNPARQIACTAGAAPVLSTHNITGLSVKVDFATPDDVFRRRQRIYPGAVRRDLANSCRTASGSNLSAAGHRERIRFPSAAALPNLGSCTVTIRACTDVVIDGRRTCHETDDGPLVEMLAIVARSAE